MTTKSRESATRGWWVRRTGESDPVVYVSDVGRLKREATALLEALRQLSPSFGEGVRSGLLKQADVNRALAAIRAATGEGEK